MVGRQKRTMGKVTENRRRRSPAKRPIHRGRPVQTRLARSRPSAELKRQPSASFVNLDLVPGAGLEPARTFGTTVFETVASTIPPSRRGTLEKYTFFGFRVSGFGFRVS